MGARTGITQGGRVRPWLAPGTARLACMEEVSDGRIWHLKAEQPTRSGRIRSGAGCVACPPTRRKAFSRGEGVNGATPTSIGILSSPFNPNLFAYGSDGPTYRSD